MAHTFHAIENFTSAPLKEKRLLFFISSQQPRINKRARSVETHQSQGVGLKEGGLGERAVWTRRFWRDSLPDECIHNAAVIQIVEIRIGVDVAKGKTVELGVGQGVHYVRLQVKLALRNVSHKQKLLRWFMLLRRECEILPHGLCRMAPEDYLALDHWKPWTGATWRKPAASPVHKKKILSVGWPRQKSRRDTTHTPVHK